MKKKQNVEKPSCWGCHHDYIAAGWKVSDLANLTLYGVKEHVCPDCFGEIPEDALA